jgi:hypothetical protein
MIHFKQGKRPRKRFLPIRLLTVDQLIKKAQQGSETARRELEKRLKSK